MRILITSDFYPPFIGGAERQVQLLARELVLRGHEVWVATIHHSGQPQVEDDMGVGVRRIKALATSVPWFSKDAERRYHPPFPDPVAVRGLRRLIHELQPEVVHANGWIAYSCAAALLGSSIPLVISVRDYGYTCALRTLLHKGKICDGPAPAKCVSCAAGSYGLPKSAAAVTGVFLGRALLHRKLAGVLSSGSYVQQIVRRDLLASPERIALFDRGAFPDLTIPTAADEREASIDIHQYIGELPATPFILFVGALQPHKGIGPLLAAYEQLESPPPLVMIGTVWPDTPANFPPGVTVLRNLPHPAVMAAWQRCLFGVTPSIWPDPLPGVVREAMSAGKALIATSIGGNVDMLSHGRTGLLVPPGDVAALAGAMRRLITNSELRERLGQAAQQSVREFAAVAAVVPRYEAVYQQAARQIVLHPA